MPSLAERFGREIQACALDDTEQAMREMDGQVAFFNPEKTIYCFMDMSRLHLKPQGDGNMLIYAEQVNSMTIPKGWFIGRAMGGETCLRPKV